MFKWLSKYFASPSELYKAGILGMNSRNFKFIAKYNLAFNLIADTEKSILEAYGVWAEKSMYGRKYMGVLRTTFVIDETGTIVKVITKVNTKDAAGQLIKALSNHF